MTGRAARWTWLDQVQAHVRDGTLSSQASHLAHVLGVHYMNGQSKAWPSQTTLAANTGYSRRTVQHAIQELERNHLLTVHRGHPARTSGNVYELPN